MINISKSQLVSMHKNPIILPIIIWDLFELWRAFDNSLLPKHIIYPNSQTQTICDYIIRNANNNIMWLNTNNLVILNYVYIDILSLIVFDFFCYLKKNKNIFRLYNVTRKSFESLYVCMDTYCNMTHSCQINENCLWV